MSALISPLAIAPMIDWSNTHFRVFMRMLAPNALVYTEMQTIGAIHHKPEKALFFSTFEQPVALQIGGSDPKRLAECARMAEDKGFTEVNLNLGCPSDRVQAGKFGACMMAEAELAAECIAAMKNAVAITVSAKTRIGIDHQDSYAFFANFAAKLIDAGSDKLIVHARKAWLRGLNPKQNRCIPTINYDYVYRIKAQFPQIPVVINGNIADFHAIEEHLKHVDGVMLGRLACDKPYAIAQIHEQLFKSGTLKTQAEIVQEYLAYVHYQVKKSIPLTILLKPLMGLYSGCEGSKQWKKSIQNVLQQGDISLLA